MANVNANAPGPDGLVPELGDIWTFISTVYKQTFGKIIYRDGRLIRIQQYNGSTIPIEFELDPATGFFLEQLGVSEIICHEKRKDPHYSKQLGVMEGEGLNLYTREGIPVDIEKEHTIKQVVATDDQDAIVLEDGTILDFAFLGPPEGIGLIEPAPAEEAPAENNSAALPADEEAEPVEAFPALDDSLLPAALVEEIPTEERIYSDTIQRTDMFTSLFTDILPRRQKDPKVMARFYRITDLLLALKNSVVVRDSNQAIVIGKHESYVADTVEEALDKQPTGAPISAILPVAAVKRVIYTDDMPPLDDMGDVEGRSDLQSLLAAFKADALYNTASDAGNPFVTYINGLMKTMENFRPSKDGKAKITVDQDVIRTHMPAEPLYGLKRTGPAVDKRTGSAVKLLGERYLTQVKDRSVRLLTSSRIRNPVTNVSYAVAPPDSAETVGHLVLQPEMAKYRSQIRSGVLLWDIQASELSRKMTRLFTQALEENLADQIAISSETEEETDLEAQLDTYVQSALNFMNRGVVGAIDSLGLRNLELSQKQYDVLRTAITFGTQTWQTAFAALQKAAADREGTKGVPAVSATLPEDSPLLAEAMFSDAVIGPILTEIRERESSLSTYDFVYSNDILKYANATLGPYWYRRAADDDGADEARAAFKSEFDRLERNTTTERNLAIEFSSEPEINECEHVERLEKIQSINEDAKRMVALDKFVKKYNAGLKDNYYQCGKCGDHLVCKHEVLLANEYLHPGRSVALHKALLLEFGNGVFEGKYICKNCGQKIGELEYDTHLEFDDDGRPLIGRSVIEEDEEDRVVIADETDAAIPFQDATDKSIYKLLRTMFERIGLNPTEEMYKRAVPAAALYIKKKVPSEKSYKKAQEKADAERKAGKKLPPMPDYKNFAADMQTGIIGAIVLLEFQTSDIEIPLPIPGTEFSRDGFPLDGLDPRVAGTGALKYVTFGLAGLFINAMPWNNTTWSPISNAKDRIKLSQNAILTGLYAVLCLPSPSDPSPTPLGIFTDTYKKRIARMFEEKTKRVSGSTAASSASAADRLPPIFRPLSQRVGVSVVRDQPILNRRTFEAQVERDDVSVVGPEVIRRAHTLSQQIMNEFHKSAESSAIIVAGNPRSDSTCCYRNIRDLAKKGFGVKGLELDEAKKEEMVIHDTAARIIKNRDPAASAAGTHIYLPWDAPVINTVLPQPKEEDYYKLFLKNCFTGSHMGLPHEYGPNNECRYCGFAIPEKMLYPWPAEIPINASGKKRSEMMAALSAEYEEAAIEALNEKTTINEASFLALEASVRERRQVLTKPLPVAAPFLERLAELGEDMSMLLPSAAAEWTMYRESLEAVAADPNMIEADRRAALAEFSARYDAKLAELKASFTALSSEKEKLHIDEALEALGKVTENAVGAVNARNVLQLFVVYGEQIGERYNNVKPMTQKWFARIAPSHDELIQKIWGSVAEITTKRLSDLAKLDEPTQKAVKTALLRFTAWLGRWMRTWINEFRPAASVSEAELRLGLRWVVVSGILSLLTRTSPLYAGIGSASAKNVATKFMDSWVLDALVTFGQRVGKYQLTRPQIDEALHARAETERAAFIKKFDDLDLDLRKVELIKKRLKIGDWAVGAVKNLFAYDAEFFEFEREQRARFGVSEFDENITGIQGAQAEVGGEMYGFRHVVEEGPNMLDNLHDADDGERD